ncbi:hypothetical protein CG723_02060 [Streptomyces sp. CB01635]|nr:hypothetical protein CG723_02060 [Streptomyces sp. CB01635]
MHGDVVDHLRTAEPFDAACAIGSMAFADPGSGRDVARSGPRSRTPVRGRSVRHRIRQERAGVLVDP